MGQQVDRQFWQCIQTLLIRYTSYNKEKGATPAQMEQFELAYTKIFASGQLKQVIINKLASIELKNDYHNIIMLTFFVDLSKWSLQHYEAIKKDSIGPIECIINQSILLLNGQQQFHTIVPKQNELICALLVHPQTMNSFENYRVLYRKLKDYKQFYPAAIKQAQKLAFLKCLEESIEVAAKYNHIRIIQFVFSSTFCELEALQETHQFVNSRLRLLKKIIKSLPMFHQDILFKCAFLIIRVNSFQFQYSQHILSNSHLLNYVISLYEALLARLIQKDSIVPLLMFKHLILNNIETLIKSSGGQFLILELLLTQLTRLFESKLLHYFMRLYDWNYLEVPICQQSLAILYQYTENRAHEKKYQHEIIKKHLKVINTHIRQFIKANSQKVDHNEQRFKFYNLKKKQYTELMEEMNEKPKKLFKRIELITNPQIRQSSLKKIVKMIKKSSQLNNKSMIDIFSTDNHISSELFSEYVTMFISQSKDANLEEFIRLFTSNFFLSGESQQIIRVIDKITQLFYVNQTQNHRIIKSSDAAYTFANAIIILNTDLHNPKNQQKISEENFIKMCKKINDGQDFPLDLIKKTYSNIKKNKINTFRDRGNMNGISVSNWLLICSDFQANYLPYYDSELALLDQGAFYTFAHDILNTIIDEKETAKLENLVQRFSYDDNTYSCQIIEMMKRIVDKKPHLPLHILQKILEIANFKNTKINDKSISYYWLCSNLIECFSNQLPTNLICEFLLFSLNIRGQLQDNINLRQTAQIKRIKKSIRYVEKRDTKKSIMDMFSSFLTSKESDSDEKQVQVTEIQKKQNFKPLSQNVLQILKGNANHRREAICFFIGYVRNQESKLFQEFVSCMFFIFNLLYKYSQCLELSQDLFYQLLGLKQSQITKRINNLEKKDKKKFIILTSYCNFWILKILLNRYDFTGETANQKYLLNKSLEYMGRCDKVVLLDLIKEVQGKGEIREDVIQTILQAIKKINQETSADFHWFYRKYKKQEPVERKQPDLSMKKSSSKEQESKKSQANKIQQIKEDIKPEVDHLEQLSMIGIQCNHKQGSQVISSAQLLEKIEQQLDQPEANQHKLNKEEEKQEPLDGHDINQNTIEKNQLVGQEIVPASEERTVNHGETDDHMTQEASQHQEESSENLPIFLF